MATIASLYLPLFYLAVFLIALSVSIAADLWKAALYLTGLYMIAWIDDIWLNATYHMLADLIIFSVILFTYNTRVGMTLWILTLAMVLNNGVFAVGGWSEFYRLSAINILFFLQCLIVIGAGYNAHKYPSKPRRGNDGFFMAKVFRAKG